MRSVAINLGIDFGTSFTKVCFRDAGAEVSGVVMCGASHAVVSSTVVISPSGSLHLEDDSGSIGASIRVPFLKMRLANMKVGQPIPAVGGLDPNTPDCIKALASWFLATIVSRSQAWLATNEADRLKGRHVEWSANVGVPVEHYDSPSLKSFEEVLGIAWLWVRDDAIPRSLADALAAYVTAIPRLGSELSDFHAVAELAAAVHSFVMSREAQEGVYVYFDIGGGTLDGVAFNYINFGGERRINFYSGKVDKLGISALAAAVGNGDGPVDAQLFDRLLSACPAHRSAELRDNVRKIVGNVISTAKNKDPRDWQVDAFQSRDYQRRFIGQLEPSRMRPLMVFIGGGGSRSAWYKESIASTYTAFRHDSAGIPPYKLIQVPAPKDFSMKGSGGSDFGRFAIAYGLSIPFGEGPEIKLPSQVQAAPEPDQWQRSNIVDYVDSKDVYD